MTDKEKIIAEIERLKIDKRKENLPFHALYYDGYDAACDKIIAYLNSLPVEQPSEELEEAANLYANKQGLELKPFARRFFIAGANWQKEQMMKFAVRGCYIKRNRYTKTNVLQGFSTVCDAIQNFKDGDKVRIIIIKEDEQ